jgi:periplasmic divalent cation tolerance protein
VTTRADAGREEAMGANELHALVMTTVGGEEAAEELAEKIVASRLGACVQALPVRSYYKWKGETMRDREWLLLVKTRAARYRELEEFIRSNHGYETPEIIRLPVSAGFAGYLDWIDQNTRS